MIIDTYSTFDPAGTLITAGGPSTNTLDMQAVPHDTGIGNPLRVVVLSNGAFAAGGAATLNIQIQGSPDNATWTTYAESGALSIAQLNATAGGASTLYAMNVNLPGRVGAIMPRYYRLNYVVGTGPFTAGAVTAWLGEQPDQIVNYPSAVSFVATL